MNNSEFKNGTWTPIVIEEGKEDRYKKYWAHVNLALSEFCAISQAKVNEGWTVTTRYDYGVVPEIRVTKDGFSSAATIKFDLIAESRGSWSSYGFSGLQMKIWNYSAGHSTNFIRKVMMGKAREVMWGKCSEMVDQAKRIVEAEIASNNRLAERAEKSRIVASIVPEEFKYDVLLPTAYEGSIDRVTFKNLTQQQVEFMISQFVFMKRSAI